MQEIHKIKLKSVTIKDFDTVLEAVKKINNSKFKTAFVVNNKNKFLGTITDGDIRRVLIKGLSLKTKVKNILKKKYTILKNNISDNKAQEIMKKEGISCAPVLNKSNKIINIKYVLQTNSQFISNKIIIMAGGKGKRLLPFTKNTPKPMVFLDNKPILEHILRNIKSEGFKNILISINHFGEKIKKYFKDGQKFGLKIEYIKEKKPLGTCGSLGLIKSKISEPFIVCNGDLISNIKFAELLNFHKNTKADVTVAIKSHEIQNPYGVVKLKNKKLIDIEEKPFTSSYVNVGVYVFKSSIIKFVKKNKKIDMTDFLLQLIKKNKKIFAYPLYESWTDVGTPPDLLKVKKNNNE